MDQQKRYTDYNSYLRGLFGQRVQKISLDAGFSCPNRDGTLSKAGCIYCNDKGSGTGLWARGVPIDQQVALKKVGAQKKYKARKFMAYFQSYTNTYAPVERLKTVFDQALACEGMVGMAVGTRPDCVDEEKLALLESYAKDFLVWVEYGLQSVHDQTLARINRGHTWADFVKAVAMTRGRGIKICAHVILGLPGEDRNMMLETADRLARCGIDGVKLHLLYVVRGTELDRLWQNGEYTPMAQQAYVDRVCDFLERLPRSMVIQRITGDPHPEELRAPLWAARYRETFNRIQQALEDRDVRQGDAFKPDIS